MNAPDFPPTLRRVALVGGAAALLIVVVALWGYRLVGHGVLAPLDDSVGEIQFKQGQRCEAAGDLESARALYESALAGRFAGPQNRVATLGRLGALLHHEGKVAAALPHLAKAAESPLANAEVHAAYCEALLTARQMPALDAALQRWNQVLGEAATASEHERRQYFAGVLALEAGKTVEAQALFLAGEQLLPGGECSAQLALLAQAENDLVAARRHAALYLAHGGSGAAAETLRALAR